MEKSELFYKLALHFLPNIGPHISKTLLAHFHEAKAIFKATRGELLNIEGVSYGTYANLKQLATLEKRIEQELLFCEKNQVQILFYDHPQFPKKLKSVSDSPYLVYLRGKTNLNWNRSVAIVGTRNATAYGKAITNKIIESLAPHKPLIVSGLAYGIDIYAHKAALDCGLDTVGVMAHGHDRLYPALHKSTAEKMLIQGALLTEFSAGTRPDRERFPQRNRIVAGLCDATLVIEAAKSGGALITANMAFGYGREVFAVPGRLGDEFSEGCNMIIQQLKAAIYTDSEAFVRSMNWDLEESPQRGVQKSLFVDDLSDQEQIIYDVLKESGKLHLDEILYKTKMPLSSIFNQLMQMELKGIVMSLPGKMYDLC